MRYANQHFTYLLTYLQKRDSRQQNLHAKPGHTLYVLLVQVSLAFVLALSQRHVQWLRHQDASVHLSHSFRRFLRRTEAHKAEAFRSASFVHHLQTDQQTSLESHIQSIQLSPWALDN